MPLPPGCYEIPFEFAFPGDAAETLFGIDEASVAYHFKVTVAVRGLFQDLKCRKQLRVIRTPGPSAWTLFQATSQETTLLDKVRLTVTLPQNAVLFGTYVAVHLHIVPLVKGLRPGKITAQILETRECKVQGFAGGSLQMYRTERVLRTRHWNESDRWLENTDPAGVEGWKASGELELPPNLDQCVQDISSSAIPIQVRHKVALTVELGVEDGRRVFEVSISSGCIAISLIAAYQLSGAIPFAIILSPCSAFDNEGNLESSMPELRRSFRDLDRPAPRYGDHELDMLYDEA